MTNRRKYEAITDAMNFIADMVYAQEFATGDQEDLSEFMESDEGISKFFGIIANVPNSFRGKIGLLTVLCAGNFVGSSRSYGFHMPSTRACLDLYDQVERAYKKRLPIKIKIGVYEISLTGYTWDEHTIVPTKPLGYRRKEVL